MGCLAVLLIALARRKINWSQFEKASLSTLKTTCFILMIIVGVHVLSFLLAYLQIPQQIVGAVL